MSHDTVRIIPLGGIGNVTKNMYVYEYHDQILIVDCGIGFPDANMLGIDLLIPDISYLKDKLDRIVGMVLTHGHDDHIAGLPYILPQLGEHFPIFGSPLTIGFAKDRLKDFALRPNFQTFPDFPLNLGPFSIKPISITHSVPDSKHLLIGTPAGYIYHGQDFKFDLNPVDGVISDFQEMAIAGKNGVLALLSDCLNSESEQYSTSESVLADTFEREIRHVRGKYIITVMSSNLHRIQQIINVATANNRKVAFMGRSIEQNVKTAVSLGYLKLSPKHILNKREIEMTPPQEVCVVIAGSQGQEGSSLARAASGEHDLITIGVNDKVIFASDAIPGNEISVYAAIDALSRTGAEVVYSDIATAVHASGHSSAIEQKILMAMVKAQRVIPIGGTYHHMIQYRSLARSMGYKDQDIHLLESGQVIEVGDHYAGIAETLELKNVMVDGLGIGDIGNIVLRDRQVMADDGIVVIIVPINMQSSQISGEIEVISRGFVYMKESQELVEKIKLETATALASQHGVVSDWQAIRRKIEKSLQKFLYQETQRNPLILPVVLEV